MSDERSAQPTDLDDLRREIGETREELGATMAELAAKADVKARLKARVAETRQRVKDRTRELLAMKSSREGASALIPAAGVVAVVVAGTVAVLIRLRRARTRRFRW